MIDAIDKVVNAISSWLYTPWVPAFLIVAGLYFTARTKFIQFRLFGESIRVVSEKPKDKNSVSSLGALMVSTASRVGGCAAPALARRGVRGDHHPDLCRGL